MSEKEIIESIEQLDIDNEAPIQETPITVIESDISKTYVLDPENELRFEVETKEKVVLVLRSGFAEIFGTEITKNKKYIFTRGAKIAVFTYHGCTVEIMGKTEVAYIATETPMGFYANIHYYLELQRQEAEKNGTKGPVVMIVGPNDVGKSTLCRILLNYGVRLGRRPIFVDLDVGQGQISIPGTIGAILVERHADPEEGFCQQAPLVYHIGYNNPGGNINLYNMMITKLAEEVATRAKSSRKSLASGVFINTCGWVHSQGYQAIMHAASAFEVDIVLSIDQERLYNELKKDLPDFVKVLLTPKSGGVVERTKEQRTESRDARVKQYFYGLRTTYYPHSFDIKFSDVKIYKIGTSPLPDSCIPLGMKVDDSRTKLVLEQVGPHLVNHILSVSAAETNETILSTNILGFVCVTAVDMDMQVMTVLSPRPRPLPRSILLLNKTQFIDSH